MTTLLLLAVILPIAAVIGAWLGVTAARQSFPMLRKVPTLYLMTLPFRSREKTEKRIRAGVVVNGQLAPVGAMAIRTVDMVTNREDTWCLYPREGIEEAIAALNEGYNPLKLFWLNGTIRPDVLARQVEEQRRQREGARYITRPLERRGIPIYRNNTWPAQVVAFAPDRASALKLQAEYAQRGVSTSVPGEGVY